jgi:hypothetical protein
MHILLLRLHFGRVKKQVTEHNGSCINFTQQKFGLKTSAYPSTKSAGRYKLPMATFRIYLLFFCVAAYGCRQRSTSQIVKSPKIETKDTISDKEIYDFMQVLINEQKINTDKGLSIDPGDRCNVFQDDSAFLQTLLIDTTTHETANDTTDWQARSEVFTPTGFGQLDKCLSKEDIDFMLEQKNNHLNFKWDNSKLKLDIKKRAYWYAFSVPLFSKDRSKVVVMIEELCPGLCGTGRTLLYMKKNNEWKCKTGDQWLH